MPSCNFLVFSPLSWLLEIFSLNSNKNIVAIFWSAAQVMKIFLWKCWMKCFNFWSDASSLRVTVQASAARATTKPKHHQKLCLQPGNKVVILFEQKLALTLWHQNSNTDQYLWAFAKIWKKRYVLPQQAWWTWKLRGPKATDSVKAVALNRCNRPLTRSIFWGILDTFGLTALQCESQWPTMHNPGLWEVDAACNTFESHLIYFFWQLMTQSCFWISPRNNTLLR